MSGAQVKPGSAQAGRAGRASTGASSGRSRYWWPPARSCGAGPPAAGEEQVAVVGRGQEGSDWSAPPDTRVPGRRGWAWGAVTRRGRGTRPSPSGSGSAGRGGRPGDRGPHGRRRRPARTRGRGRRRPDPWRGRRPPPTRPRTRRRPVGAAPAGRRPRPLVRRRLPLLPPTFPLGRAHRSGPRAAPFPPGAVRRPLTLPSRGPAETARSAAASSGAAWGRTVEILDGSGEGSGNPEEKLRISRRGLDPPRAPGSE